jgi:hypothetical protein
MKAAKTSHRSKQVEERKAKRIAEAEQLYLDRQLAAEKRHEIYIQSIKGKAVSFYFILFIYLFYLFYFSLFFTKI